MIKRIVFDLDNTLLPWKKEYVFLIRNILIKLNIDYDNDKILEFDNAVTDYESSHYIYDKKDFINFINQYCHSNLPDEFIDMLIKEQGQCFDSDPKLVDTIKYLGSKYDLALLSNWFTETQKKRLEGVGILKYFTFVSGGDERPLKPNLEAFTCVLDKYLPNECLMVGDSLNNDIKPALELGMNAIWITNETSDNYQTIKNIYELKDIL